MVIKWYLTKLGERDILTIICTFAVIGIIGLIYDLCLLIKRKIFGEKYLSKYEQWMQSSSDEECYQHLLRWLRRNSTRMMDEMGGNRIINFYDQYSVNQGMLERYIGKLDYLISKKLWQLINPFVWLTRTVRLILLDIPFWMLRSVGLISVNRANRIRNHSLSDKIIGVITLLGFVVSLITDWDSVVKFFRQIFRWLGLISID
ncbi:hypothetical protein C6501_15045 [Candidatus Poribacteria bacterium]|nr:MAG: hypothetical protein C6501_15045 [Candidatus Poribacteria bacterium]